MATKLLFGGDVMLGRLVKEAIAKEGLDYPLSEIRHHFQHADISIVNLECAITSSDQRWHGMHKVFYFGAPPDAAKILKDSGINVVSLANNHILDFDYQGLHDTLRLLDEQNIYHAGAGKNSIEAKTPTTFHHNETTFAMMAYCDHQEDFTANTNTPGLNYLDTSNASQAIEQLQKDFNEHMPPETVIPILSLHWGPNMVLEPSQTFIDIAHGAIDLGYKIFFGHSAHVFQGIEIYKSCPIIYAAGDLVDDYAIDPYYKNDHGLLFELEIHDKRTTQISLYPIFLDFCRTVPANPEQQQFIMERFSKQCTVLGTNVDTDQWII